MSAQTRAMVFPARAGVHVDGVAHGPAIALPGAVAGVEGGARACFAVPYSACDLNGHLNNARALDAAEDLLAGLARGRRRSPDGSRARRASRLQTGYGVLKKA